MAKRIIPNQLRTLIVEQIRESVSEESNTVYYAFIADHITEGDTDAEVSQPVNNLNEINVNTYRNMIAGKRYIPNDFALLIPKYVWSEGTVYDRYDDRDVHLFSKKFFTAVDEDSYIHVYKCLDNSNGAPSMFAPIFDDVANAENGFYETGDGYLWKYMFTVDSVTYEKFSTQKYMPVVSNSSVTIETQSISGTIDVIVVEDAGRYYNNHIHNRSFVNTDFTGNPTIYALPSGSSTVENYYANTILHLTSGKGAGQYRKIISSFANGAGVYVQANAVFETTPDITTTYEISPMVSIIGNGDQLIEAEARAIVNSNASNSIHRIEVLNTGSGYNFAQAEILIGTQGANNGGSSGETIEVEHASIRPILPPLSGHGANSSIELGACAISMCINFENNESNTIISENTFARFGIIRDPLFENVVIDLVKPSNASNGSDGSFRENEIIHGITLKRLYGDVNINASNAEVESVANNTQYINELNVGEYVLIKSNESADYNHYTTIKNITSNTHLVLNSAPTWTASNCEIYFAKKHSEAIITDVISNTIVVEKCQPNFRTNDLIVGTISNAIAFIDEINIRDRVTNFNTFNQMQKLVGVISSLEDFVPNEKIYQVNSGASASLHSIIDNTTMYITQIVGEFDTAEEIIGEDSNAVVAAGFNKYKGELNSTSGSIIYIQNDIPVERSNTSSEQIRVILEF